MVGYMRHSSSGSGVLRWNPEVAYQHGEILTFRFHLIDKIKSGDIKLAGAKLEGKESENASANEDGNRVLPKTKVLEKDYVKLKASFDKLKTEYESLCKENEKMKNEQEMQ